MRQACLSYQRSARSGFTMLEMLVSIGVISLLMSLLLPAVPSAREAARATQCRNNLHQIGVALHSFHEQHGFVDTTFPLRAILPQMDAKPLWEELELADEIVRNLGVPDLSGLTSPSVYLCPSDSLVNSGALHLSYAVNAAPSIGGSPLQLWDEKRQFREVVDGLSNTAAFSERLIMLAYSGRAAQPVSEAEHRKHPLRTMWQAMQLFGPGELDELALHSLSADVRAAAPVAGATTSHLYVNPEPVYNHLVPPNNWPFTQGDSYNTLGPAGPSSEHDGGAHVLSLDGSVHFISNSIDMEAFWALGTINGGESVSF